MEYEKQIGANLRAETLEGAGETRFTALEDASDARCFVTFDFRIAPEDSYVMLPACAYDGNRFDAVRRKYPPFFLESEFGLNARPRMTEVPRLARDGSRKLEVTTGDLATPCVALLDKKRARGYLLFTEQRVGERNVGITLSEAGGVLRVRLDAPAHRSEWYYWKDGYPTLNPPEADIDQPLSVKAGEEIRVAHDLYAFDCESVDALYRRFFALRAERYACDVPNQLPFSEAWRISERKYNDCNVDPAEDFFNVSPLDPEHYSRYARWQAGWVGGGMVTLVLLWCGGELSRRRALNTLDFALRHQTAFGLYVGIVATDGEHHDCFGMYEEKYNALLIRKHADLSYFFFKHFLAMEKLGLTIPERFLESARKSADAMVAIFERYGQLGQFVNCQTGEILVGGSSAAGIAPGALALAYQRFGEEKYLETALALGKQYLERDIASGVTTGGPGEILSAPDSESVSGILEGFITLYEVTRDGHWLRAAESAAWQTASWIVPYNYEFPEGSEFRRLDVKTAGSVFANVQNKHSAPGIATLSASAFFKLYRATGEKRYLDEMRRVTRFIVQTMPYPGHEIYANDGRPQPEGWICERVNMSDWEGQRNVGEIFYGSCWCETSQMLAWLEIPGVYVDKTRRLACASDHVQAQMIGSAVEIINPTKYDAVVKVLVEDEAARALPLGAFYADRFRTEKVPAFGRVRVEV